MSEMHDVFGPPAEPTECFCLHCRRVFMSDLMIPIDVDDERHWMCPVPGCGAMGYTFDIFPVDSRHPDAGWVDDPESDEDQEYDPSLDQEDDEAGTLAGERIAEEVSESDGSFEPPTEWTPEADRDEEDWEEEWYDEDDGEDTDPETFSDEIEPWENGESGEVTHPRRRFTREDYETARQSGVYDEAIAREREHWRQIREQEKERKARIERGETLPGDQFSEDDIPF